MGRGVLEAASAMGAHAQAAVSLALACQKFGIHTPLQQAHFLGQLHVESMGFKRTVESMNYSAERLISLFSRSRISIEDARKFGRVGSKPAHQNALANILYGGNFGRRRLGNTQPGDGWRFRGRGLIQTTGRFNYTALSRAMFGDDRLVVNPDALADYPLAAESAAWYWKWKDCNSPAARNDCEGVTDKINPALLHLQQRLRRTQQAIALLS